MPRHLSGAEGDVTFGQKGFGAVGSEFHFLVGLGHFLEDLTSTWFGGGGWGSGGFIGGVHCLLFVCSLSI